MLRSVVLPIAFVLASASSVLADPTAMQDAIRFQVRNAPHGSRVYVDSVTHIHYTTRDNAGRMVSNDFLLKNVQSVSKTVRATIVTYSNGTSESFPSAATVNDPNSPAFEVVPPNIPVPRALQGRTPDYIVP